MQMSQISRIPSGRVHPKQRLPASSAAAFSAASSQNQSIKVKSICQLTFCLPDNCTIPHDLRICQRFCQNLPELFTLLVAFQSQTLCGSMSGTGFCAPGNMRLAFAFELYCHIRRQAAKAGFPVIPASMRICDIFGPSGHIPLKHLADSNGSRYTIPLSVPGSIILCLRSSLPVHSIPEKGPDTPSHDVGQV